MRQGQDSVGNLEHFGILCLGFLGGTIVAGLFLLRLQLIPPEGEDTAMQYSDLAALLLTGAALFVGIIVPLFGAFGYILARREAVAKAQEVVRGGMQNGGELHLHIEDIISKEFKDDGGTLRQFIQSEVKKEVARRRLLDRNENDWGNEMDEYGEVRRSKDSPK